MKKVLLIIVFGLFFASVSYADRASMESYFESNAIKTIWFDDYDDWDYVWNGNTFMKDLDLESAVDGDFPTESSGDTDWDMYGCNAQSTSIHTESPIRAFGSTYCANGKCIAMSSFATTTTQPWASTQYNSGPGITNNLGGDNHLLYFGDGDSQTDGNPCQYQEVYLFMRVYFPIETYPTQDGSSNMDFDSQGSPYMEHDDTHNLATITSNKWIEFLSSRVNGRYYECQGTVSGSNCTAAGTQIGDMQTYRYNVEDQERWFVIKNMNAPSRQLRMRHEIYDNSDSTYFLGASGAWGTVDVAPYMNTVAGVEFHAKVESTPGVSTDGEYEVWWYDTDGNATLVLSKTDVTLMDESSDGSGAYCDAGFNMIHFHSNWRTTADDVGDLYLTCGGGMHRSVYYDDIIIDDARIGPTYYSRLMSTVVDYGRTIIN